MLLLDYVRETAGINVSNNEHSVYGQLEAEMTTLVFSWHHLQSCVGGNSFPISTKNRVAGYIISLCQVSIQVSIILK